MAYIEDVVKSHVDALNSNSDSFSFLHAEQDWQNLNADEMTLPVVFLDMPIRANPVILQSGAFQREYILIAVILYKDELDTNPTEQKVIMNKAWDAQKQLQLRMNQDKDNIKTLTVGECYEIRHLFDVGLSGVVMPFRIVHRPEGEVCLT